MRAAQQLQVLGGGAGSGLLLGVDRRGPFGEVARSGEIAAVPREFGEVVVALGDVRGAGDVLLTDRQRFPVVLVRSRVPAGQAFDVPHPDVLDRGVERLRVLALEPGERLAAVTLGRIEVSGPVLQLAQVSEREIARVGVELPLAAGLQHLFVHRPGLPELEQLGVHVREVDLVRDQRLGRRAELLLDREGALEVGARLLEVSAYEVVDPEVLQREGDARAVGLGLFAGRQRAELMLLGARVVPEPDLGDAQRRQRAGDLAGWGADAVLQREEFAVVRRRRLEVLLREGHSAQPGKSANVFLRPRPRFRRDRQGLRVELARFRPLARLLERPRLVEQALEGARLRRGGGLLGRARGGTHGRRRCRRAKEEQRQEAGRGKRSDEPS